MHLSLNNVQAIEGLQHLINVYRNAGPDTLGLFLGAGVNLHPDGKMAPNLRFKTYCWQQLLEVLYKRNQDNFNVSFDDLCTRHGNDWQGLASELVGPLGVEEFVEQMDEIIHDDIPRKDSYGRLSKRLLNQAPTLKAALCFTTKIREQTETSWTFERNPKIGTVVTTNYDFFFGAGWTCYQAFDEQWKVQTPFSKGEPNPGQGTINYIHGYVPYRFSEKRNLVLTRESYKDAYATDGFAPRTLRRAVSRYNLIFLSTSFKDDPLCEILEEHRGGRKHIAIVKSGSEAAKEARRLGLNLVVFQNYGQIAEVLKEVYCTDLSADEYLRVGLNSPDAYWERLEAGPVK